MRDFIHVNRCSPFDDHDLLISYFLVSDDSRVCFSLRRKSIARVAYSAVVGWERRKSGARSIKTACQ